MTMINTIKCFRHLERCIKNCEGRNVYGRRFRKHYTSISDRWENDGEMLEEFLVESESKWYMSPFELQYCTYYHHVMRAREFATKQLNEWNDAMKEKEKTRITFVHGNVSLNHFYLTMSGMAILLV